MPHSIEFRVRYAETDQMGVVYHSVYFVWFEQLRTEYFRALEIPYGELESRGVFFPVVETGCRYKEGARYDGLVRVTGWLRPPKGVRVRLDYTVEQEGRLLRGGLHHPCPDGLQGQARRNSRRVDSEIRARGVPTLRGSQALDGLGRGGGGEGSSPQKEPSQRRRAPS